MTGPHAKLAELGHELPEVVPPVASYVPAVQSGQHVYVSGQLPIVEGRGITDRDRADAPFVAVVNETMARRYWPRRSALGGRVEDVVRTRIYLRDVAKWEPASRAHGRVFGDVMPANTMIAAGDLIGDYEVEIEAEAVVDDPAS